MTAPTLTARVSLLEERLDATAELLSATTKALGNIAKFTQDSLTKMSVGCMFLNDAAITLADHVGLDLDEALKDADSVKMMAMIAEQDDAAEAEAEAEADGYGDDDITIDPMFEQFMQALANEIEMDEADEAGVTSLRLPISIDFNVLCASGDITDAIAKLDAMFAITVDDAYDGGFLSDEQYAFFGNVFNGKFDPQSGADFPDISKDVSKAISDMVESGEPARIAADDAFDAIFSLYALARGQTALYLIRDFIAKAMSDDAPDAA